MSNYSGVGNELNFIDYLVGNLKCSLHMFNSNARRIFLSAFKDIYIVVN